MIRPNPTSLLHTLLRRTVISTYPIILWFPSPAAGGRLAGVLRAHLFTLREKRTRNLVTGSVIGSALLVAAGVARAAPPDLSVGMTVSRTGQYATASQEQQRGFDLWVEETNARGGLLGRRIKVRQRDDRSRPELAGKLYEQLLTEERVDVLIGPYSSPATLAAGRAADKHGVPMISAGASAAEIWSRGPGNVFGLYTPADAHLHELLDWVKARGLKRVALVYEDSPFQRDVANGVKARAKGLGLALVFEEKYGKGQSDFASVLARLKTRKPDIVIGGSYLADSVAFMRQARESKLYARVFAFAIGPALPEFGSRLGLDAEGVMGASQWEPDVPLTGARDFAQRYQARHGHPPATPAVGGYAAGQVLEAAVQMADAIDRDKLRAALRELETVTVLGPYRVEASGRQIGKPAYVVQWIDGVRHVVLPEEFATHKPVYPFRGWSRR